ncbi:hypothetical protein THAOC_12749 [Thalassiosira oceanica]|uniref:Uncharacterized protein n=1 Tax=Thalassiosira oceanica TaxID=159749 RepID=K0SZ75_THAOC|nr:hypothetical protein THAOC_12749 [Thalassiosira oceanica]|eukprot:EJK66341.1 hypothetical protein THAOC_12749 [Thalassiosira oceanica]
MSSQEAADCNALEATTSIEEITGDENNRDILRSLQNDEISQLWLCRPGLASASEDYELSNSWELDWLGHFAKKSTRLESVGIFGDDTFGNCSGHFVDRLFHDLGKCNHIKKMHFAGADLAEIIDKVGVAMKNNNFTQFFVDECYLGVPEATFVFNSFREMMSPEELRIDGIEEEEELANLNDGTMASCIPSLAACTGMQSLQLNHLNLSTNSCAALTGVFPQMATLLKLALRGNSLDDDCTRLLALGLPDCCKQIQTLDLSDNRISDNGLDALVQSLPTSVDALYLTRNDITLARHVLLLRFGVLNLMGNALCAGGTRVIAVSLANPECRLEYFNLNGCGVGDEGTSILADGLRNNQRLTCMSLGDSNITERGWNAFSSILCDASSINATHNSNHTLQNLGNYQISDDVETMLRLNKGENKSRVAANKILQSHRDLDMTPLFGRELGLLPYVVAWLENFVESRPDLKLSSIFEFFRAMPMKVANGVTGDCRIRNTSRVQLLVEKSPSSDPSPSGYRHVILRLGGGTDPLPFPVRGHPRGCRASCPVVGNWTTSGSTRSSSSSSASPPSNRRSVRASSLSTPRTVTGGGGTLVGETAPREPPPRPTRSCLPRPSWGAAWPSSWRDARRQEGRRQPFAVGRRVLPGALRSRSSPSAGGEQGDVGHPSARSSLPRSPGAPLLGGVWDAQGVVLSLAPATFPPAGWGRLPGTARSSRAETGYGRRQTRSPLRRSVPKHRRRRPAARAGSLAALPLAPTPSAVIPSLAAGPWDLRPEAGSPPSLLRRTQVGVEWGRPGSSGGNDEEVRGPGKGKGRQVPNEVSDRFQPRHHEQARRRKRQVKAKSLRPSARHPPGQRVHCCCHSDYSSAITPSHGEDPVNPPPTAVTANVSARKTEKGRRGEGGSGVVHCAMSSQEAVGCNALDATTSIEDITGNEHNRDILRSLQNDELSELWLCRPDLSEDDEEDYGLGSSRELDWLGHFAKKSTSLESISVIGSGAFGNCSRRSVDRFLGDLGQCNHIKKLHFNGTDLAEIIHKLGPAMKNNSRTHFTVEECYLGVPEATFLFNTFGDMNSLEELCIEGGDEEGVTNLNDDEMAVCIPSLAACTGMRSLTLAYLNLSTNSCAALRGVFPRMATIREVVLRGNSLDDDCTRLLAQGLSGCKQIQSLKLCHNRISDNGLDVLVQGLPASVDALLLSGNDITLARHVLLLRFRVLNIWGNTLCPGGTRVIASSLANPECRLEYLYLSQSNIGDDGTAILADSLRNNQSLVLISLGNNNITERGWNAILSILCDTSSINATYNSNHTLQDLDGYDVLIPQDVEMMLHLNQGKDKRRVAANKILQSHRYLDMRPLFGMELGLLPYVVAWLEHFAKSRPDLKLSSIFEFVRAMPMKVTDGVVGKAKGEKRKLNS